MSDRETANKSRVLGKLFFTLLAIFVSTILAWLWIPALRVLGYQSLALVGPKSTREWSFEKLQPYKEKAVPAYVVLLQARDSEFRQRSVYNLGELSDKAAPAVPALINSLQNKDVQQAAIVALGRIGEKASAAIPALIEQLQDKDPKIRRRVNIALGKMRNQSAVPALVKSLEDEDYRTQQSAALALMQIGRKSPILTPKLIALLSHENDDIQENIAWILRIQKGKAVPPLITLLDSKDIRTRREAARVLIDIGEPAAAALPALNSCLQDPDKYLREIAKRAIERISQKK